MDGEAVFTPKYWSKFINPPTNTTKISFQDKALHLKETVGLGADHEKPCIYTWLEHGINLTLMM